MNRKPRLTLCGLPRRKIHMIDSITRKASAKPTSGESTIGITTLSTIVFQCTTARRRERGATRPPISACEDDDGRPKYQVMRFQLIAPMQAGDHDHQAVAASREARWSR